MTTDLFAWPEVEGDINIHGPLSVAIPASVAGYEYMHRQWGRLPLADVIAPAIALAKRGLPQDWYTALKVVTSAPAIRLYPHTAAVYLPNGLPPAPPYQGKPGFFRQGNLPETLERLGRAGLRDFYEGDIAASVAADVKALGGVLSLEDLRNCQARTWPAEEVGWRGRTLQLTGGLTAAPTLKRVLEGMADAPYGGHAPSPDWYRTLARVMKARLCRTPRRPGRVGTAGGGKLHHASDRVRRRREYGGDDHHADVLVRQPRAAAAIGRAAEQRHDVVRSASRRAERDRAGQAAAVQHAADHPRRGRTAVHRRRRFRRAADPGGGVPAHDVHRGFRHGRGDGGASSAHRCVQRRQCQRRCAAAGGGA